MRYLLLLLALTACTPPAPQTDEAEIRAHRHPSDDSTLTRAQLPLLLPYNRVVAPAGHVVRYGDPLLENHALDLTPVPGTPWLAVLDRYGVALLDTARRQLFARWSYAQETPLKDAMSVYSGLKVRVRADGVHLFWSAANGRTREAYVLEAVFAGGQIRLRRTLPFAPRKSLATQTSVSALPNDLALTTEAGRDYLYVALNGNNELTKLDLATGQSVWTRPTGTAPYGLAVAGGRVWVSNWGGWAPTAAQYRGRDSAAGVPEAYGLAYVDQATGATAQGTVSIFDFDGSLKGEIEVGLHPTALLASPDERTVYVACGNADAVAVLDAASLKVRQTIDVRLDAGPAGFGGDTPTALALDPATSTLYVALGLDNAVAVVQLGAGGAGAPGRVVGFIPTEAYPGGLALSGSQLFVSNLEGEGARVSTADVRRAGLPLEKMLQTGPAAYNSHRQLATVSLIPQPTPAQLAAHTEQVRALNLSFRQALARRLPRPGVAPRPVPARIGEPSVFRHVVYIIKENRTYDQVFGDIPTGRGAPNLCVFGDSVTPNQHALAREFVLLDNYHAAGKCSAEGHQWTDAGRVTDYVERSVRAWFRSYPHVQEDALVYAPTGFIWNHAADHGKRVRIYGEACEPHYDKSLTWTQMLQQDRAGQPLRFHNTSTIARVRPLLSPTYPGADDLTIPDQVRATAFIKELKEFEKQPGEALPELSIIALAADHTVGTRPGLPTPRGMVADNDLALGRIVEALSRSRFWQNTVVFVTEDDSQSGWDHLSAYRTTGQVLSAYSRLGRPVSVNYNQVSMLRTIEQILGLPPMNALDATARPMFECFADKPNLRPFSLRPARINYTRLNQPLSKLTGAARRFGQLSAGAEFDHVDGGRDEVLNRILWFATKGPRVPYPVAQSGRE